MPLATSFLFATSVTTTTLFDPHKGSPLPVARVIVLAIPVVILTLIYLRLKGLKK